ncbi:hypothetical protein MKW94_020936 [Papaver nudicaule]|uniref:SKP1-like protein n=1 Tax=Papaver nudicaule TaxID=74823 RepID=A0AA41VNY3_PAPNU|nr:hypothetical protein [Papaver nudicaule]
MSTAPAMTITLRSSDEQIFVIEETIALQSKSLERMIADNETGNIVIPLTTITGNILARVIEYCNKHAEVETSDEDKQIWDAQFMNVDISTHTQLLFDMIQAANTLEIKGLTDLATQRVANWITGKTPEEMSGIFPFKYQVTPEEEEWVRRKNEWAFQE